jgi:hypothetical protein
MDRKLIWLGICFVALAVSTAAQTNVTNNNDGTSGAVPVYSGSATVTNSPISISGGNVGIGTTSPGFPLDVAGNGNVQGYLTINGVTEQFQEDTERFGNAGLRLAPTSANSYVVLGLMPSGTNTQSYFRFYNGSDPANVGTVTSSLQGGTYYTTAYSFGSGARPTSYAILNMNLGIGTTAPSQLLEVNGTAQVDGALNVSTGGIYFAGDPTHTPQTMPYTGVTCGGDYAESVDVTGDREHYAPGDVLVIDPDHPGKFLKSAEPYSTSVTGIYSTKPGMVGRRQTGPKNPDEVPMAMIGIVPTKVSAENGPILPGDLLVTSSTIGYAMKGTDRNRMLGAVIGKALGNLASGNGVIEVVVTLQ